MEGIRSPPCLQFTDNVAENWRVWKQQLENYLIASDKYDKDDKVKVATLLNIIGIEGLQIYNSFDFTNNDDRVKYDKVIEKFELYCTPKRNIVYEHFRFFSRSQLDSETTDQYLTALKALAANCNFAEREVMLLDRIVLGTKYKTIQEKLLKEPELTLDKAIEQCHIFETTKAQIKEIQRQPQEEVDAISYKKQTWRSGEKPLVSGNTGFKNSFGKDIQQCTRCGYTHEARQCPAFRKTCNRCMGPNHFAKMCRYRRADSVQVRCSDDYMEKQPEPLVWEISAYNDHKDWIEYMCIEGKTLPLKIDTGSQVNILNKNIYDMLKTRPQLIHTPNKLISYTGHPIEHVGKTKLRCTHRKERLLLEFYITKDTSKSLLGLEAARRLNLLNENTRTPITVNTITSTSEMILQKYSSVFEGSGKLKQKHTIRLAKGYIPVAVPPRRIPIAIQQEVKAEIKRLENIGILKRITEPTEWASPIVIVRKPGKQTRICMDPRNLNKWIIREKCWTPTAETIFSELNKAKFFTVLDASNAFHQIQLDEKSSWLCTITTPFGRYRYTRLPYGLCSAPEVFQQTIGNILEGMAGVVNYMDDILIFGTTLEEHNDRLARVLQRIDRSGLKLSKQKTQLAVKQINYLGHLISQEGIQIDPNKVSIVNMKTPKTKLELQQFLGLVTYLSNYVPRLSEQTAPLRAILCKKNQWTWEPNGPEEGAFRKLKETITSAPTLKHFDKERKITLSVDASRHGLGAVLLQENGPVAYASASLSKTQQNYSQIEKELLAIVNACEHFHYYIFGTHAEIQTDHKPLLAIVNKPLDDLTPRLQRMVLRLMRYDINLTFVPGKQLQAADALSRNPESNLPDTNYLDEVKTECPIQLTTSGRKQQLLEATNNDSELGQIVKYCMNGWPAKLKHLTPIQKKYWNVRDELQIEDHLLYKGNRLCIPRTLQNTMLNLLHNTHQGIVATKSRAREALFWPGIMKDIQNMIMRCDICQEYSRSNSNETLTPHDIPEYPWHKVGMDFKSEGTVNLLVLVDYFSKYAVVHKIRDKTAETVIESLKSTFAILGIPDILFTDNGPPFDSIRYNNFLKSYDIQKNTSSPGYPKSNGMIERTIQTVKAMITKACREKDDLMLAVLNYNATPKPNAPSPAELIMGRKLKTLLPIARQLRNPWYDTKTHYKYLVNNSETMKKQRTPRTLEPLSPGQPVYIQKKVRAWEPAEILSGPTDNSFVIRTNNGNEVRRNRIHLKPRLNNKPLVETYEEDDPSTKNDTTENLIQPSYTERASEENQMLVPNPSQITTRSGRVINPPKKLDL